MTITKQNTFGGGTDGTAMTTANTGGTSGDAANLITAAGTLTFSTAEALYGTLGCRFTPTSGGFALWRWNGFNSTTGVARIEVVDAITVTAAEPIMIAQTSASATVIGLYATSAGKWQISNGTTSYGITTTSRAAGDVIEIVWTVGASTTTGQIDMYLYHGINSTTVVEHLSSAAANLGTTNWDQINFGKGSASTWTGVWGVGRIAAASGTTTLFGPLSSNYTAAVGLSGSGTLTAAGSPRTAATVALSGSGTLAGTSSSTGAASADLVNATTASAASGNTLTIAKPPGVTDGDYLFAFFEIGFTGATFTLPDGTWTMLASATSAYSQGIAYKHIATASAETATSYAFQSGGAQGGVWTGTIVRFSGLNQTSPIDQTGAWVTHSSTTQADAAVTPGVSNSLLVAGNFALGTSTTPITITPAAGFSDTVAQGPGTSNAATVEVATKALTGTTSTGAQTFTWSPAPSGSGNGYMFTVAPVPTSQNFTATVALSGSGSLAATASSSGTAVADLANATTATPTSGASLTIAKPPGVVDGDYLFCVIAQGFTGGTLTLPDGTWTLLASANAAGYQGIAYKAIPTASAETATTYTFAMSGGARWAATMFRVSGLSQSNPIDATGTWVNHSSTTQADASVTSGVSNALLVACNFAFGSSTTQIGITTPGGFVDTVVQGPGTGTAITAEAATKLLGAAAATGTQTFTWSIAPGGAGNGYMFTLAPVTAPLVTGTAGFSGGGTLAAAGSPQVGQGGFGDSRFGDGAFAGTAGPVVALSGSGTLGAAPVVAHTATATLSGSGALSAAGQPATSATVALSGGGSLAASTSTTYSATVGLSGSGTLTAAGAGTVAYATNLALAGGGQLAAAGTPAYSVTVGLSGGGTLTSSTPAPAYTATAALSGGGTLTAAGHQVAGGGGALSGSGSLVAAGTPSPRGQVVVLTGGGQLTMLVVSPPGQATLAGGGQLTAAGVATLLPQVVTNLHLYDTIEGYGYRFQIVQVEQTMQTDGLVANGLAAYTSSPPTIHPVWPAGWNNGPGTGEDGLLPSDVGYAFFDDGQWT